jgi:hypothetical protein
MVREVTIHTLWVELADRAGQDGEPDVRAGCADRNGYTAALPPWIRTLPSLGR